MKDTVSRKLRELLFDADQTAAVIHDIFDSRKGDSKQGWSASKSPK